MNNELAVPTEDAPEGYQQPEVVDYGKVSDATLGAAFSDISA